MTRKMTKSPFPYVLPSSDSGNHPCQHDRGLARRRNLYAARRSQYAALAFDQFSPALPAVADPSRGRLGRIARFRLLAPPSLKPASLPAGSFLPAFGYG
jgi:hypothetical protein